MRERCRLCEEVFESSQLTYYHDSTYCPECLKKMKTIYPVSNYNFKPMPTFYNDDGKPTENPCKTSSGKTKLYMGMELEIDDGDFPNKTSSAINALYDGNFFYCKHDGSLEDNGVEIVTHPATLKCWENHIPLQTVRDICIGNGYRSDETDTCGLHVHVNKDFFGDNECEVEESIAKLILLNNRFWSSYIVPFSRRSESKLERWAGKNTYRKIYSNDKSIAYGKIRNKDDRYQAINISNRNTVEFRIFKGSLNINTILSTLQFVDRMCHLAKKIKLETLMKITWSDVVGYKTIHPELKTYLETRHIMPTTSGYFEEVVYKSPKPKKMNGKYAIPTSVENGHEYFIRSWEELSKTYGLDDDGDIMCDFGFTKDMAQFCGRKATVYNICFDVDDSIGVALKFEDIGTVNYLFSVECLIDTDDVSD